MSHLKKLQSASSLEDLAKLMGFSLKALTYLLYIKPGSDRYNTFTIPKKNGGVREISAPSPDLKNLQKRVSEYLQYCLDEIHGEDDRLSHGFRKSRSILTNAEFHKKKRYVFNIDLKDFFGTINFGRVRGYFISNNHFKLNEKIATALTQIICFDNKLPQGSPSSPVVSNLIGHILDIRLANLSKKTGCHYSRYADDLTFSTNKKKFHEKIAKPKEGSKHQWIPGKSLEKEIKSLGFVINADKTRMLYRDSRQDVTGIVTNVKLNTSSTYRRNVRAMVHALITNGEYHHPDAPGKMTSNFNILNGMLGYIGFVENYNSDEKTKFPHPNNLTSTYRTYQKFRFYTDFLNNEKIIFLCEGKTDNIYLECAIEKWEKTLPELYKTSTTSKEKNYKFINYNTISHRLFGLSGGSAGLCTFIDLYSELVLSQFKSANLSQPVIIIADNDKGIEGNKSLKKKLDKHAGGAKDGLKDFYHICLNLYVVLVPKSNSSDEVMIEDLFDKSTLSEIVNGRSFNYQKNIPMDKKLHYDKYEFATKVVKEKKATLTFNGFVPLLKRIQQVIASYKPPVSK